MVVKDFARKRGWVRAFGRIQIRREAAAYRWLSGLDGFPAFHGRLDAHALAVEYVEAQQINFFQRHEKRRDYFERLREIVEAMHARGVIHNDLRAQENVVVVPATGRVVVLDLGGAVRLRPGSPLNRLFFPLLSVADRAALLKWKLSLAPELVSDEEKAFLERFARWRRLWLLNPKGMRRRKG
jgi:hypothetical protein